MNSDRKLCACSSVACGDLSMSAYFAVFGNFELVFGKMRLADPARSNCKVVNSEVSGQRAETRSSLDVVRFESRSFGRICSGQEIGFCHSKGGSDIEAYNKSGLIKLVLRHVLPIKSQWINRLRRMSNMSGALKKLVLLQKICQRLFFGNTDIAYLE